MPSSVGGLLAALLDAVVQGYADAGVDLPTLRYVAPGFTVAYDTEQLTTNFIRQYAGRPGQELSYQYPLEQVFTAEMQATVIRAVSVVQDDGAPPPLQNLEVDADVFLADVDTMTQVLVDAILNDVIVPRGVPCTLIGVDAYGPAGGVAGVIGKIAVQLV